MISLTGRLAAGLGWLAAHQPPSACSESRGGATRHAAGPCGSRRPRTAPARARDARRRRHVTRDTRYCSLYRPPSTKRHGATAVRAVVRSLGLIPMQFRLSSLGERRLTLTSQRVGAPRDGARLTPGTHEYGAHPRAAAVLAVLVYSRTA